jgi:Na+-transporting NADH:ubiquinone oxidoreductase subunit NqrB
LKEPAETAVSTISLELIAETETETSMAMAAVAAVIVFTKDFISIFQSVLLNKCNDLKHQ